MKHPAFVLPRAVLACCALGSAPMTLHAQTASAPDLAFAARWLPTCDVGESRTYFSVEVFEDGRVRYVGGPQAREQGQKTAEIHARDARRLALKVASFSRGRSSAVRQPENGMPPDACIEVSQGAAGNSPLRRESIETRAGGAVTDDIARVVRLREWACPGRVARNNADGKIAAVCGRWNGAPRIGASFTDERGCPSYHEVTLYDDGSVYYSAHEFHAPPGGLPSRQVTGEAYYALSRHDLQQVDELVATFNLQQQHFDEPNPHHRRDNSAFSTFSPEEVARFRDALAQATGARWVTVDGSRNPACQAQAYLSMRADVWRRLRH